MLAAGMPRGRDGQCTSVTEAIKEFFMSKYDEKQQRTLFVFIAIFLFLVAGSVRFLPLQS
jgi:hypothetical protein